MSELEQVDVKTKTGRPAYEEPYPNDRRDPRTNGGRRSADHDDVSVRITGTRLTPAFMWTVLASILGGIVWGVQLNFAYSELNRSVGKIEASDKIQDKQIAANAANQKETAAILKSLTERFMNASERHDRQIEHIQKHLRGQ